MALILEISQILMRQWFLLVFGSLTNACSADVSNQRGSKRPSLFVCAHKCTHGFQKVLLQTKAPVTTLKFTEVYLGTPVRYMSSESWCHWRCQQTR